MSASTVPNTRPVSPVIAFSPPLSLSQSQTRSVSHSVAPLPITQPPTSE
ncbi:MAG: hypothetical protein AAGN15_08255 [Cyanobacteria bacterium J06581_3]